MTQHRGGIFTGLSSRGSPMGLGTTGTTKPCTFATGLYSEGAKAIQNELIKRGALQLKADGLWGPCSESAYEKVTGEPLSAASILANYGINCSPYIKKVIGTACKSGTDVITQVDPPPAIDPTQPAPPVAAVTCPAGTTPVNTGTEIQCQAPTISGQPPTPPVAPIGASLIPGVSNLVLFGGLGVVVLGAVAYFALKAPSPRAATTAAANKRKRRYLKPGSKAWHKKWDAIAKAQREAYDKLPEEEKWRRAFT